MAGDKENKYALGNQGGRPPIYNSPIDYENKCFDFFQHCIEVKEKPTITGLELYLGFCSRGTLNEYAKKDKFSDITKRAMLTVENSYENGGNTIDIFALKNMGWKDKVETDNTNRNYNTTLTEEEKREHLDKIKKGLNELDEY